MLERWLWAVGIRTKRLREWMSHHDRRIAEVERRLLDRERALPAHEIEQHVTNISNATEQLNQCRLKLALLEREVAEVARMLTAHKEEGDEMREQMIRLEGIVLDANKQSSQWANSIFHAVQDSTREIKSKVDTAFTEIRGRVEVAHQRVARQDEAIQDMRDRMNGIKPPR